MKTKKASEVMTTDLITATEDMPLTDVMSLLVENNIGCLPVVDEENHLLGVITAYDVMNSAASGEAERTLVRDAMSRQAFTFTPDHDLATIVNACLANRMHRVPIVDRGVLVGLISRRDIIREILSIYEHKA